MGGPRVNSNLLTPELSQEVMDAHEAAGLTPIVIYPEDVVGNPLGAPFVMRILWYFAGRAGGPVSFDERDLVYAFSENIALDYQSKGHPKPPVMFVPTVDPREFIFSNEKKPYQVVYAGKYRTFVGIPPQVGQLPTVEIWRDGPKKQGREVVKKLISEATVVYSFEDSAIILESILSGTPAGYIPNEILGSVVAEHELGWGGIFFGEDLDVIQLARDSIPDGVAAYSAQIDAFARTLEGMILRTQKLSFDLENNHPRQMPSVSAAMRRNRVKLGLIMIKTKGFRVFFRTVIRFLRSTS
jgi:hypothetical protein